MRNSAQGEELLLASKPKSLTDRHLDICVSSLEARLGMYVLFTGPGSLSLSRKVELRWCLRLLPTEQ